MGGCIRTGTVVVQSSCIGWGSGIQNHTSTSPGHMGAMGIALPVHMGEMGTGIPGCMGEMDTAPGRMGALGTPVRMGGSGTAAPVGMGVAPVRMGEAPVRMGGLGTLVRKTGGLDNLDNSLPNSYDMTQ